ncbi:MAG: NUDIX domain-containing protein [Patescibacteria group bacterium]
MAHINEKLDFCVEVFIVHKNKVLLRMHDKYKIWLSVGGHIDPGEDPVEAALREVKEEVGLDVKIIGDTHGPLHGAEENRGYKYLIPPRYMGRHPVNDTHEHVAFVYFATSDSDVLSEPLSDHEKAETRWVSLEELEKMDLIPNIKFYAGEALKELSK